MTTGDAPPRGPALADSLGGAAADEAPTPIRTPSAASASSPGTPPDRHPLSPLLWLSLLVSLIGIVLRVRAYAANRSLWLDEAQLALTVIQDQSQRRHDSPNRPRSGLPSWAV